MMYSILVNDNIFGHSSGNYFGAQENSGPRKPSRYRRPLSSGHGKGEG